MSRRGTGSRKGGEAPPGATLFSGTRGPLGTESPLSPDFGLAALAWPGKGGFPSNPSCAGEKGSPATGPVGCPAHRWSSPCQHRVEGKLPERAGLACLG